TFTWDETTRDEPLYAWTGMFLVNHLGVPLGIARTALDAAADILLDKIIAPEMRPARDEPRVRVAVARAHALVGSARSYAFDVVADFWATLTRGERPSRRQRAALAGAYVHTARVCREAAELLADAVGTSAVFRRCALERHRRDLATACAHLTAQDRFLELVGGLWIEGADLDHRLAAGGMIGRRDTAAGTRAGGSRPRFARGVEPLPSKVAIPRSHSSWRRPFTTTSCRARVVGPLRVIP